MTGSSNARRDGTELTLVTGTPAGALPPPSPP
jgi:hypothetical protein